MSKQRINNSAKDVVKKNKKVKLLKRILLVLFLTIVNLYIILWFVYKEKSFTVYLEKVNPIEYNLTIYEKPEDKRERAFLNAKAMPHFSASSIDWLPGNLHQEADGAHNGNNYIAYTFYAENQGHETVNYTASITIDDVVKNLDEAVRIMVYKNDERTVYAKPNKTTGQPEENTKSFVDDTTVMFDRYYDFKVGDIDKYTVVIFIEGTDEDCTDALIGGEIGLYMTLKEEQLPDPEPQESDTN